MNSDWSPLDLDRKLARAAAQWRAWRLRWHAAADPDDAPLEVFRGVIGLTAHRELGELPENDALKAPFRAWVYRLAEQRINHDALVRLARAWQEPRVPAETPRGASLSLAAVRERCLGDAPRRELWTSAFIEHAHVASPPAMELWQRRREIARRMYGDERRAPDAPSELGLALARDLGALTRERVRELRLGTPAAFVACALGQDVPGSWPARLSPARLYSFFRETDLFKSLEVAPARLPPSLGAASLGRGLARLGAAWFEALAPQDQPFVVAHDPYGLKRHEAGALFALLLLSPRFVSRHLDISAQKLSDVRRRIAQIWLLTLAEAALRVQLRAAAWTSEHAFRETFSELMHRELSLSLPQSLAGTWVTLGVEDERRLFGQLLAVKRQRELVEAHDEDWFRNPRAIEQLRAEANRPPEVDADPDLLRGALALVTRELTESLR